MGNKQKSRRPAKKRLYLNKQKHLMEVRNKKMRLANSTDTSETSEIAYHEFEQSENHLCTVLNNNIDLESNMSKTYESIDDLPELEAPTTKPKTQKPSASTSCEQEKKTKVCSLLPIIAKVYLYLEKEYECIKTLNGNNCDLSPLEDILRRTSEATDVSEEDVISILDAEGLSDHLPPRARSKRRKILQCSTENDRENDDLIEDDDILQEENDNVTVKLEITEDTEIQHGLIHSSCNMDYGTPATDLTQVKSEPQEIAYPHTDSIRYLEVTPLTSTSGSNNSVEYTIQTRVKLEQEEDETMTDNLLLPNRPGSNNSVEETTQTRVKLECEEDETTTDTLVQPKSNPSNEPATLEPADTAIKLQPEDID